MIRRSLKTFTISRNNEATCTIIDFLIKYLSHSLFTQSGLISSLIKEIYLWTVFILPSCWQMLNYIHRRLQYFHVHIDDASKKTRNVKSIIISFPGLFMFLLLPQARSMPLIMYDNFQLLLRFILFANWFSEWFLSPPSTTYKDKYWQTMENLAFIITQMSSLLAFLQWAALFFHRQNDKWFSSIMSIFLFSVLSLLWLARCPSARPQ